MSIMKWNGESWVSRDGEIVAFELESAFKKVFDVAYADDTPSLTKQEFKDECDINKIMAQYQRTGLVSHVARYQGDYSDVADAVDYQTALNIMKEAQDMFMTVPSSVRSQFDNDPGKFLEFVQDPNNAEKMYEMGLAVRKSEDGPLKVEVTNVKEVEGMAAAGKSGS